MLKVTKLVLLLKLRIYVEKHISCPEKKILGKHSILCFFHGSAQFLGETFVQIYKSCDQGKEKFMKFQLEWHKMCSIFLLPSSTAVSVVL